MSYANVRAVLAGDPYVPLPETEAEEVFDEAVPVPPDLLDAP
jgi:hypothetical protein